MCNSMDKNSMTPPAEGSFKNTLQDIHVINTILNNSTDTIYFKDLNSRFLLVSKAQAIGFGCSDPQDIIGKSDFDFFPADHAKAAFEDEQKIIRTGIPIAGKVEKLVWPTGKISWMTVSKYPLYDLDGSIMGTWGNSTDITELKLAKEEIEKVNTQLTEANRILEILSAIDGLSGLYNHRLYFEEAQKEYKSIDSGYGNTFSIILIDVDNFKKINDIKGHLCGDYAIKHIAEHIGQTIRISDKAFRYGGDEFIVLLPNTGKELACKIAEQIRSEILKHPVKYNEAESFITISAGIASSYEASSPNDLLVLADKRLYRSKEQGRNKITSEG